MSIQQGHDDIALSNLSSTPLHTIVQYHTVYILTVLLHLGNSQGFQHLDDQSPMLFMIHGGH